MDSLETAHQLLQTASRICVLTGAGFSAESGIPTFRGPGGLWKNYRPEDLATPAAFARDPELVWNWYQWRRGIIAAAQPNSGHAALVELEARSVSFALITQNVDGLHQRAGSRKVLEVHDSIWRLRCTACG
ncbi:MAG: Sir2 family NAD-dependent protein deacetylase, partial [Bryobacteraceae bacterium]